jgi:hypothetical protein
MRDMSFCANSAELFKSALAIDKPKLEQAALEYVTDHGAIGEECPAKPAVKTAVKKGKKVAAAQSE